MKKLIAALIGVPIAIAANIGDDVMRFFARYADDAANIAARNADNASTVATGLGGQADDAGRLAPRNRGFSGLGRQTDDIPRVPSIAQPSDEVARVSPGVVNLNKAKRVAKQAVYEDVHNAVLSGVNENSINELMAIAKAANEQQFQQTGVLLSNAALISIVYQAGAASAPRRSE